MLLEFIDDVAPKREVMRDGVITVASIGVVPIYVVGGRVALRTRRNVGNAEQVFSAILASEVGVRAVAEHDLLGLLGDIPDSDTFPAVDAVKQKIDILRVE